MNDLYYGFAIGVLLMGAGWLTTAVSAARDRSDQRALDKAFDHLTETDEQKADRIRLAVAESFRAECDRDARIAASVATYTERLSIVPSNVVEFPTQRVPGVGE